MGNAVAHLARADDADLANVELHDVRPMNNTGNRSKISMFSHWCGPCSTPIRAV
jgi:hypothetical protein